MEKHKRKIPSFLWHFFFSFFFFGYGLSVYGALDSDLTVIQNFPDRCFKRKYTSKRMDIRELLVKADKKLFKVRSVDPDCPLSNIIPKKKDTNYK